MKMKGERAFEDGVINLIQLDFKFDFRSDWSFAVDIFHVGLN